MNTQSQDHGRGLGKIVNYFVAKPYLQPGFLPLDVEAIVFRGPLVDDSVIPATRRPN
jgi:hypothetical protein